MNLRRFILLFESLIDFPYKTLDPEVWDVSDEKHPVLKPEVKQKINEMIQSFPNFQLESLIDEIRIVGSICTNRYIPGADIDVHIVPKFDVLKDILRKNGNYKNQEDMVKEVKKYSHDAVETGKFKIGQHPIELYIQLDPEQDMRSDGVYDIKNDKWLVGPKIVDMSYDPYQYFSHLMGNINDIAKEFDIELGELKRDVIDYDSIKNALQRIPSENRKDFKAKLENKLSELEKDIKTLAKSKKEIIDLRHNSSKGTFDRKKFDEIAVKFKFLDRYMYFSIIKDLEKLIDDEELSHDEVEDIKKSLLKKIPSNA